jgi:hypothetical protein
MLVGQELLSLGPCLQPIFLFSKDGEPGMVIHPCNSRTWDVEVDGTQV